MMKPHRSPFRKQLLLLCLAMPMALGQTSAKKNIIFFLADDQRDDAVGCYGNEIIKTPTLDKLAANGVRFDNAFCQVPICAASRASIFTGMTQRTHGFNFREAPVGMDLTKISYPVLLKKAGYRTGFAGKFGVNFEKPGLEPEFDFFREINRTPYLHEMKDGSLRHETDLCADAAIEFIDSASKDTPFCLSISFNATHAEDGDLRPGYHFQWPESADGLYEDVQMPLPKLADPKYNQALPPFLREPTNLNTLRFGWRWDTPEKYQTNMRAYYRLLTGIDNAIARVLKELEAKGLAENTVIIYSADNGFMMGDRGLAGKWNHYEQSLRVPLIVFDPSLPQEKRGRAVSEMALLTDMAPTFLDLAGATIPKNYQGLSLLPLIEDQSSVNWRDSIFVEHHFKNFNDWRGIRGERYKYAIYFDEPDGPYEVLYDLEKDPTELTNLAGNPEYSEVLKEMKASLEKKMAAAPERKKTQASNSKKKKN